MSKPLPLHNFGSGANLNFKIRCFADESLMPAQAVENTIAVITGTEMTAYVFSSVQPEEAAEGMIWIQTGTASHVVFNLLKNNAIFVYPVAVFQYESGEWVNKEARSFLGGVWQDWIMYAFYYGDTCNALTGGWEAVARSTGINPILPTLEIADGVMKVSSYRASALNYFGGTVQTKNKIDLSAFSSVTFCVTETADTSGGGVLRVGVAEDAVSEVYDMDAYADISGAGDVAVDISGVNSACVIAVNPRSAGTAGSTAAITVEKIILDV